MTGRARARLGRIAALSVAVTSVAVMSAVDAPVGAQGADPFTLDIIHINDHHSRLTADTVSLSLGGGTAVVQRGGFPRVVAAIDELRADLGPSANVATIHAGDAITGSLYYTLFKGEADAAMMNEVCFDMFTIGNHEFDGSDQGLVDFLTDLAAGPCTTDVLSSNIVPELGTPLMPDELTTFFEPYVVKTYGDEQVGYIGLTVSQKTKVSSLPLETTIFLDEVETVQGYIDELTLAGVDKIVGVTHQGYGADLAMVAELTGIDAVVGGDSHSLLGDFAAYGLTSEGAYPTQVQDAAGDEVCVVQAWQYSHAVGHLTVDFDANGDVTSCTGTPYLMLGPINSVAGGATMETAQAAIDADPKLWQVTPDVDATAALQTYADQVTVLSQEVIGTVSADIGLTRFPTTTFPNGGPAQQLVTDAFLARAFRADIALQNSGGVRIVVPAGDLTVGTAYTLLPFANTLYEIEMTGAEIVLALEQGLGNVLDAGGSTGAYPYGSGIRWDVDASKNFGERFSNVEVRPKGTVDWNPIDLAATYVVVANSFMASGGDGYTALRDAVRDGRGVDTFLDYAQSFIDYVQDEAAGTIGPPTEFSTKSYIPSVVPASPTAVTGTRGNGQVVVSWTAPTYNGGTRITRYNVTASPDGATCVANTGTSCTVSGLTNGTAYTFTVTATNSVGASTASSPSAEVTPATVPDPPTGVTATAGNAQATVSWTAPVVTGGAVISSYTVTASPDGATCVANTGTSCDVLGLTNGTPYTFTVTATNVVGESAASEPSSAVTPATTPGSPSKPTATAGNRRVVLTWNAPVVTGGAAITDYVVEFRQVGAPAFTTFTDGVRTTTGATVTGLANGTRYEFRVSAVNAKGTGSPSPTSSRVTPFTKPSPPAQPTGRAGDKSATVRWTAPANGGSAITDYVVQFRKVGASTWSTFADGTSTRTNAKVTGLRNGTRYEFRVAAANAAGRSNFSPASAPVRPAK